MNDWRTALRDGDPAAHAQLPNDAAQAMRRAVLAQVASRGSAGRAWMQPVLVAATVALMVGTGAVAGRRAAHDDAGREAALPVSDVGQNATRQMQFATPGGTRIIWVFNSEFDLNESIP
jgi:hypothetical protein